MAGSGEDRSGDVFYPPTLIASVVLLFVILPVSYFLAYKFINGWIYKAIIFLTLPSILLLIITVFLTFVVALRDIQREIDSD